MGWTLDPSRGAKQRGLVSLALVLWIGGVRRAQIGGVGPTYDAALEDVIAEANRWLRVNTQDLLQALLAVHAGPGTRATALDRSSGDRVPQADRTTTVDWADAAPARAHFPRGEFRPRIGMIVNWETVTPVV